MRNIGYLLTDWIFFFNDNNTRDLQRIVNGNNEQVGGEFVTYKLITVFLPVVPYAIVVILNIFLNINDISGWFSFLNNGSLPIISFGIISAGMPYLLEQLQQYPNYHVIRRRVMAVSLIFLFLTAALYIFQTIVSIKLNPVTSLVSLILSIYIFFYSASIGYKMFILQSKNIETFDGQIANAVGELQHDVEDL